jgi:menaquinone reductase, iron-sulfur cluster-binding subunit
MAATINITPSAAAKPANHRPANRFGMVVDLDRCNGCGSCTVACSVENNIHPCPDKVTDRTGVTWMRVYRVTNGEKFPEGRSAFIPMMCQQCGDHTPCASVCPQQAVEVDPFSGIVDQMPQRCLGCRYCMTACPYSARYFNWWDPVWPAGMEQTLNPDVAPRMRGVVEKCDFCQARLQAAQQKAAAQGERGLDPADYVPACVANCPAQALTFGDLNDPDSAVSEAARNPNAFRMLEKLGTDPKVYYVSAREWVRKACGAVTLNPDAAKENAHG